MNNTKLNNYFSKMREERLSPQERDSIRANLLSSTRASHETQRNDMIPRVSSYFRMLVSPYVYGSAVTVFVAIFSVSYAAERSVPGNMLYPMKVGFVEPFRGMFLFSNESNILYDAELAEERLSEIDALALRGKLSKDVEKELFDSATFKAKEFSDHVFENESLAGSPKAAVAASRLEAILDAHRSIKEREIFDTEALTTLQDSVDRLTEARIEAEKRITENPKVDLRYASERELKEAEQSYKRAKQLFESKTKQNEIRRAATSDMREETVSFSAQNVSIEDNGTVESEREREFNAAKDAIEKGREEMKSGSYSEAFRKALEAGRAAKKSEIMLKAQDNDREQEMRKSEEENDED